MPNGHVSDLMISVSNNDPSGRAHLIPVVNVRLVNVANAHLSIIVSDVDSDGSFDGAETVSGSNE